MDAKYQTPFENYKHLCEDLCEGKTPQADLDLGPWRAENAKRYADVQHKYAGYFERIKKDAQKLADLDNIKIPAGFDPAAVRGLLFESAQKLREVQPQTLGQASRIPGVTPADMQLLAIHIERFRKLKNAQKTH